MSLACVGSVMAACSQYCLLGCSFQNSPDQCKIECGCPPDLAPDTLDDPTTIPSSTEPLSPEVVSALPEPEAEDAADKSKRCSFQCISMCESQASPDCQQNCEKLFCSASVAFTSDLMETTVQGQSWGSWLASNLFVGSCLVGLGYWAKRRLHRSKRLPKRLSRKINEFNSDTYYRL
jgi:hypothetical protein